jgi:pSer/pThr/pTyr-binding forkhead associated (FHA) protein
MPWETTLSIRNYTRKRMIMEPYFSYGGQLFRAPRQVPPSKALNRLNPFGYIPRGLLVNDRKGYDPPLAAGEFTLPADRLQFNGNSKTIPLTQSGICLHNLRYMKTPPMLLVQLVHISGPLKGEIQEFSGTHIAIGRHPSSDVRFPADLIAVSRNHAEILREGNQFKLMDHSTNGTFVNGKPVKEVYLKNGDVMTFADGGPRVSFLTEIKEAAGEVAREMAQPPPPPPQPPVMREPPRPPPPRVEPREPEIVGLQPVKAPLTIQYGPTIRSFKILPMTLGRGPACEFVLNHPAILDAHAQIFFFQNEYWVKDLTGRNLVAINLNPVGLQRPLRPNDSLSLSPAGPTFLFLGDGRLAEVAEPEENPTDSGRGAEKEVHPSYPEKSSDGFFGRVKKILKP